MALTELEVDIAIVGAGPAGCAAALSLADSGLSVVILDKDKFPRDKICGDALSADVVNQLYKLNREIGDSFLRTTRKHQAKGIRFYAPNGNPLDISFQQKQSKPKGGFVMERFNFDHFIMEQVRAEANCRILEGQKISGITVLPDAVELGTPAYAIRAKMALGADGANSILNRTLVPAKIDRNHHSGGLRQYFENVRGMQGEGYIELHFYKEILPGYLWIFPLPNNRANVGIGMLSRKISERNIDLKATLHQLLKGHPNLKFRFKDATPLETPKGFGLPLGSKKRKLSGDRFLLLGDAASLIDPFTGEGIGNAIRSGRLAAAHCRAAFKENRFDADFNLRYDNAIYKAVWKEMQVSRQLQHLLKFPWLFNFIVKKASRNTSVQLLLTAMLDDIDLKRELAKPGFYLKLFFR